MADDRFVSAVLDTVAALIVVLDRDGRIVRFNRACEQLTGYPFAEVQQRHVWDLLLVPEEVKPVKAVFGQLQVGDFPLDFENYWVTKSGRRHLIAWSNTALTGEDDQVEFIIATGLDVTEQRAVEQEIKHISSFPLLNPSPVLEVDTAGAVLFHNPAADRILRQLGVDPDPRLFVPRDLPAVLDELKQPSTEVVRREVQIAGAFFAENLSCPPGFETIRIFAADVTDRKRVETANAFLAAIVESSEDAIIGKSLDGQVLSWNRGAESMYGWRAAEIVGRSITVLAPPDRADEIPRILDHIKQGEVVNHFETQRLTKTGRQIEVSLTVSPIRDALGVITGASTIARDMTARKQAEAQVRYQAFLLENVSDAIVASDVNFIIQGWNKAAEELYGWLAEEVIGRSVREVLQGEFSVPVAETTRQLYAEGGWKGEVIHTCKDGRRLHILASVRLLRDEAGKPIGVVSANRDITERKQIEQQLREFNAALQARNEELDAFAQTVAHDIKNPLHLIAGSAEVLSTYYDTQLSEDTIKLVNVIQKSAYKANDITDNLLLLSDVRRAVICEPLDMAAIVSEARQRLTHLLDDGVNWHVPDVWPVALGYAPWVEEIWVNYLHNALKYAGRPLCLELGSQLQPDGVARFWVRDNGIGISPEKQADLFSISKFISRSRGGHGLGLSIVKRLADKLGGEVGVESSGVPGDGSLFYFTLPADSRKED